jgi:hypothetical protein
MTQSPIIAFGLKATTVALKAKTGQLRLKDKLDLTTACLEWLGDDAKVRDAVVSFLASVDREPIAAADMLQAVAAHLAPESDPRRPEVVLKQIESERPEPSEDVSESALFDWQKRADLQ